MFLVCEAADNSIFSRRNIGLRPQKHCFIARSYKNLPDLFCGGKFTLVLWFFHAKGEMKVFLSMGPTDEVPFA